MFFENLFKYVYVLEPKLCANERNNECGRVIRESEIAIK